MDQAPMHADGVSEAKRYAAGDNEEKEGAPRQKHWPKGDGQESHRADPERLRRAPAHLAVEGIGFVVRENAFRAGHQLHATRFAPVEDALGGCARLACMSIRRDSNADAEADHHGAATYGRLTPRSSAALRKSGYFCAGNGNFGQVCARRLLRAVALGLR